MDVNYIWYFWIAIFIIYIILLLMNNKHVIPSLVKEHIDEKPAITWRRFMLSGCIGEILGSIGMILRVYFVNKEQRLGYWLGLILGILFLVLGIVLIFLGNKKFLKYYGKYEEEE